MTQQQQQDQQDNHQGDPTHPHAPRIRALVGELEALGVLHPEAPAELAEAVRDMAADGHVWHLHHLREAVNGAVDGATFDGWCDRHTDGGTPRWRAVRCDECGVEVLACAGEMPQGVTVEVLRRVVRRGWSHLTHERDEPARVSWAREAWYSMGHSVYRQHYACAGCVSTCERCGEVVSGSDITRLRVDGDDAVWCDACADRDSACCGECGESVPVWNWNRNEDACADCVRQREEEESDSAHGIAGYHDAHRRRVSRPVPSAWSKTHGGLYLGVELEVEMRRDTTSTRAETARAWQEAATRTPAHRLWIEHDGSLSCGWEAITDPHGLDTHRALWPVVLADPATRALRSHATDTCGLHVHVSRRPWQRTAVARCAMWHNLPEVEPLIRAVARRYGGGYCGVKGGGDARTDGARIRRGWSELWARPGSRYELVNLSNACTVEFRLFRGSLHVQAVLAACEWSVATLRYATATPCQTMHAHPVASFLAWLSAPEQGPDTAHLRPYLRSRLERTGRDDLAALVRVAPVKRTQALAHSSTTTTTEE